MPRTFICAALAILAAASQSYAETPHDDGPPPWGDNASVYLTPNRSAPAVSAPAFENAEGRVQLASNAEHRVAAPPSTPPTPARAPATPPASDPSVRHAFHQAGAAPAANEAQRRLPPPSAPVALTANDNSPASSRRLPSLAPKWESIGTTISALGVVIGFLLICAWLLRRGAGKSSAGLPREVVSVLGRVPLAARNVAQLLRVGNKLVLVSLTPTGAETLTEVTDPAEVDRLVGLCHQSDPHSTTKAFEQVFRQLSFEPVPEGFMGKDSLHFRGDAVRG
jgi:flagellar biogenesis protein FliO